MRIFGSENLWLEFEGFTRFLALEDNDFGESTRSQRAFATGPAKRTIIYIGRKDTGQLSIHHITLPNDLEFLKMLAQRALGNPAVVPSVISIRQMKFCERKTVVITCCESQPRAQNYLPPQTHHASYSKRCIKYVFMAPSRAALRAAAAASPATETFGVTESGKFTLSESVLRQRGFELLYDTESLSLDQLNALFVKVGFPRRQKERLARALEHTLSMVWLRDQKSQQLIAFARATGDDVFNAIIWDVVVDPSFQGLGFGKVVIERLMADLVRKGISNIALYAEPHVVGFYKPLGFIADPDGIRAMAYARRRKA